MKKAILKFLKKHPAFLRPYCILVFLLWPAILTVIGLYVIVTEGIPEVFKALLAGYSEIITVYQRERF